MVSVAWRQLGDIVTFKSPLVSLGVVLVGLAVVPAPAEAQTIQGCKNPAGQVRLIGDAESCKSQETLVTWNSTGWPTATRLRLNSQRH